MVRKMPRLQISWFFTSPKKLRINPHSKTHKCGENAKWQIHICPKKAIFTRKSPTLKQNSQNIHFRVFKYHYTISTQITNSQGKEYCMPKVLEEVVYSLAHLVSRNSSLLPSLPGDQTAYFLPSLPGDQLHRSITVLKKRKARR